MKKSLPTSISILALCLIALAVFAVSMQRGRAAADFPSLIATWIAQSKQGPAAPLVGPVTVTATAGTTGPTDYATLKAAFDAINAGTHQGTITVAIVADTTEAAVVGAASVVLNASGSGSASYASISIQPSGGAPRTISGAATAGFPLIDVNGADNVTIDGLNTGGNSLTISNSQTSSTAATSTIRFINDATSNTIQNAIINGAATGGSTGTIIFGTTTGTTGNDNNTITACNIGPVAATFPTNAIFSSGTTTSATTRNSGVSVTNNNIFDFYNSGAVVAGGINLAGSTDWTITGNSFYQTASRAQVAGGGYIVIGVADTTGVNFTISNNFIGGSAASAGGTAWTETGATTHTFIGIRMSVGSSVVSSLQNNTIQNINNTTATTSTINAGISAVTGAMNIGTTTGNTIGATTGTGSITWTSSGANQFAGILAGTGTPNGINISNNKVGSLTVGGTAVTTLYGIRFQGAATAAGYTVSGNVIGSTSTANSITNNSNGSFVGISGTQTQFPATVSNNTIQNLQVTSTGTSASLRGIELTGSISGQAISGNTIRDFSTASTSTGATTTSAIVGIVLTGSSTSGNTITTNTIRDLSSTTSGATAVYNQGILITSTPGTTISRNFVFNLTTASTSTTSSINGIQLFNSSATENIYNNMMRLGLSVGNNPIIRGIYDNSAPSSPTNIYFNSIYIDGTQGAATVNTACISKVVSSTMDVKDNILWNNRASTGAPGAGAGRHYGIQTTSGNPTSNYNDIYTPNNGGAIGFSTSDQITLANWRTATSQDLNSQNSDPKFQDATNATTPDLHINPSVTTFVEGNGILVSPPTDDFDGQTRSTLTPVDIGADAGNFTGVDLTPPVISYTPLANTTSTSNRALASTITDGTGVPTIGAGLPVIYYRKGVAGAFSSTQSTFGGGSTYNFAIDYSLVSGGSVTTGDTIQYYVVAQDTAATPNVIANPSTGASGYTANPPAASTPPTTPNSYMIVAAIAGTKTVGTGGDYATLTGALGLFADINSKVATSNLVIQIISDLTVGEDGTNGLNPLAEEPAGSNFTVKIFPTGAARAITGTHSVALIRLNAADRVTIDGSIAGTGTDRSLTITNSNVGTSSAVVWMQSNGADGATNNNVKNLNVVGSGNTQTLFGIGSGNSTISISSTGTGNNSNTIQNNNISKTQYGIYSGGLSAASKNTGNTITQNLINTVPPNNVQIGGILVNFESGITISQNNIAHINTSGTTPAFGITLGVRPSNTFTTFTGSEVMGALVSRNVIDDVIRTGDGTAMGLGVADVSTASATANTIVNNSISGVRSTAATPSDFAAGMLLGGGATSSTKVYFNSISMTGSGPNSGPSFAIAVGGSNPTVDLRDNIFYNIQTPTTGSTYAIGLVYATPYTNLTSDFNDFLSSGTTAKFAVTGGLAGTNRISLAAWRTETGKDANSLNVDPTFNSTSNLQPQSGSLVLDAGTSLSGTVTPYVDITGATRVDPPSMGAYEGAADTAPPVITYTPLANTTSTASRMLSSVVITDTTGVNTTAGTRPRIYYKKSSEANAFVGNTSADNGWKFVETSDTSSPFSFTINYALLTSAVVAGDTIQYFVVAQDTAATPNVGINSGTFATAPTSVSLGAAQAPIGGTINNYMIVTAIAGTKTVGTGGDYATLTGAGGLFADINGKVATSNLVIQIISDLTVGEDGTNGLNPLAEEPAGSNFTVKIFPTGAARAISGTNAGALIRLNAADRVTIDGSIGGTGTDRSLTITNTNVGTSSAVVWMQSNGADGATNNTVKNLNVAGSGNTQTLIGIGSGSSTVSTSSLGTSNNNNTIQNNSISKTQYGIYSQGASVGSKNTGNVITQNLMNAASPNNVSKGGIQVGFENNIQITQNTIDGVTQASSPDVFGIALGLTSISTTSFTGNDVTNATVTRNFIGKVTNTGTFSAVGISVASTTSGTNLIANNSIYGVGANGTSPDFGAGIFLGGGTGSTTQVYFNAVSMTGTFTGGGYPNYALAIGGTDPTVDARDNILYNTLVNGTGISYAIGTASSTFVNLTSNYNDLFTTSGATFKIGHTGSLAQGSGTDQTLLSDWQTATGKDANSISTDPQFNSTTNLQPQTGSPVIDAGTSLTGLVSPYVDITGATRVDPPSMGAYEGASDTAPPVISYTPLANTSSNANRMLSSVVITDGTGVNTTAGTRPRIYYKKSTEANAFVGNTGTDNGWKFVETSDTSSPFSFTLNYALLTSAVVTGDTIQYFVVAQDTAVPANVGINSGTFATTPTSVNLGAAQAPIGGTINSYLIAVAYAGSLNVGTGETITSLTNAGGLFQTINNGVLTGNLTINITSDLTVETGAVFLNQIAEEGAGNYTLTLKPSGAARTISGTSTGGGLVVLNGADRVVIDGSLSGGTDRSLTITNGNASGTVIWIASASASNGANNNTIKNCTISGNTGTIPIAGVLSGSGVTLGNDAESPNSNNTIQNNAIFRAQNAMYLRGNSTTLDQNWMVTGNTFGSTVAADKLIFRGMLIGNAQSFTISGNTINGVSSTISSSSTMSGILAAFKISGGTISGNKISDIKQTNTTGWGSNGIYLATSTTTSNLTVSNNFIFDVASQGFNGVTSSDNGYGIMIDSGGGYNIYHNSVNLSTNQVSASSITAAINIASAVTTSGLTDLRHDTTGPERRNSAKPAVPKTGSVDLRDNILVDGETVGTRYSVYDASTSGAAVFANIDFNDYFAQNVGFLTSARATLADWQTATGQDANSKAVDPVFVSSTDLHLQSTSPILSMGTAIGIVATDYDNDPRPASNPDIGADELVQAVAGTIPGGTFYNAKSADGDSLGGNVSITNVIYLNGKLSTGANTLGIGCSASISGGGASNYVIGNLKKTYCAAGSKNFEVGTANGFSPVAVNITAGTFPADFTTKAVQGAQPNIATPTKALQRYWTLTGTGVTADLTFNYLDPTDIPGTANENNFVIFKYNGSFSMPGGSVNTGANTASIAGVTSFSDWTLAEPGSDCGFMLDSTSQNFVAGGGMNSVNVTAGAGCMWTAVSNDAFITVNSGSPGSGNGTVNYTVAANTGPARMGTMTIAGITFTVTQNSGCTFMLSSMSQNFVAAGGMNSVNVTAGAGCMWTAVSNDAFITVNSGTPGSGNGTVNYTVTANTGPARMGTMTIAGITFTVTQNSGCTFMLSSMSQNFVAAGGMNSVNVTAGAGCMWTAVSNDAFIIVDSGTPGSGNGTVNYHVTANTGQMRTGTMTIAGITFTVTQDSGCTFMLTPTSQNFVAAGGMNSVNVTQTTSCSWTAVSNDAFIIVDSGTPGSGNGTVNYHVTANTGPMRTGTMTIAGITFTVTQDAACAFMLSSTSQNFVAAGGMDSVNVITGTGCTWTAVSNNAFITVNSGTPGSGNGTVGYTVAANVGPARMGTMTIAGITFTVTQDGGCTFTLSRDHQSFPGNGGPGSVNVTASDSTCPWTASTTATYIHITSGTPGTGNGALQYTVDVNPGPTIRSDTITIAGHTYTVYQGINFLDVPPGDPCYDDIGKLAARGVTVGCGGGNYCPNAPVLRDQMAAFILRAKGEFDPPTPASQRFNDVPPPPAGNIFYNFIDRLAVLGITVGCQTSPPLYCPSDPVKRDQMAAFILRGLGEFDPPVPGSQRFNDVPPGNVFYNFIDRMAVLGITLGCQASPPLYCPSNPVTRCQMASFLVRAFDL
jgi:S-layer family protein/all-beta uncharacterized protein